MLLAESLLGSSSAETAFIEDVFSTWLYTGNGSTQTITNGIDLAGKGGLVWSKRRSGALDHYLSDTVTGTNKALSTSLADAQLTTTDIFTPSSNGLTLSSNTLMNASGPSNVLWTFREQPRFFDVVTYTGNGAASRSIAHSLGSTPGCVMVKRTDATGNWKVLFPGLTKLCLNSTESELGALVVQGGFINTANATTFTLSDNSGSVAEVNASGGTYVAYLFAHDAGGFGATGTDNVISCGSYVGNGSATGPVVTLGYEPQWLLIKRSDTTGDWNLIDNMRGFAVGGTDAELNPNLSNAESTGTFVSPTATGFQLNTTNAGYNANGGNYMYIAIRRGPMRTPTTGTSVFGPDSIDGTFFTVISPNGRLGSSVNGLDAVFTKSRTASDNWTLTPRLTGFSSTTSVSPSLSTNLTDAESVKTGGVRGGSAASSTDLQAKAIAAGSAISYSLGRAPGFFDVVCYTGTGVDRAVNHNLGVVPEFIISKKRSNLGDWFVYVSAISSAKDKYLVLNNTDPATSATNIWPSVSAATFGLNANYANNESGSTYVAYLFASCPGVSKVGSYTGMGATQTINCGFAAGARFVLIKRTDSTGDWFVWDSARGIVAANDPYLTLNTANAEVTNTDWVDTAASGFELSNAAGNLVNTNGASYIFLAIA